eukprot:14593680-Ditylum_brightwellii.AAC.1
MAHTESNLHHKNNFSSTKETVECLGHLTNINLFRMNHAGYQELINVLLIGAAMEKVQSNEKLFEKFNTTVMHMKYDVQVRIFLPANSVRGGKVQTNALAIFAQMTFAKLSCEPLEDTLAMIGNKNKVTFVPLGLKYDQTIKDNATHYLNLLCEQNTHLKNYADFQVGGLTEEVLGMISSGKMAKENILASQYVIDIHKTIHTEEKGMSAIEITKENLQQAIKEIDLDLEVLQKLLPDEFFTKNPAFPVPCIIPNYGVLQNDADKIIYNVADNLEQTEKNYNCLPKGAWS